VIGGTGVRYDTIGGETPWEMNRDPDAIREIRGCNATHSV